MAADSMDPIIPMPPMLPIIPMHSIKPNGYYVLDNLLLAAIGKAFLGAMGGMGPMNSDGSRLALWLA
jgi:hypothetical protein